jgi:hypothetical protein
LYEKFQEALGSYKVGRIKYQYKLLALTVQEISQSKGDFTQETTRALQKYGPVIQREQEKSLHSFAAGQIQVASVE